MAPSIDLAPVLAFAKALRRHNNREWFLAHRTEYDAARSSFAAFVAAAITGISRFDPLGPLDPADCIFRVHRDVRFSRDKTPYKPYLSAYLAPGGRKATRLGYYVHLEPGKAFLGGGLHHPEPSQLAAFRQAISEDARPFRRIIGAAAFRDRFGEIRGDRLRTVPRGFPRDHPELGLLRLTSVTAAREVSDGEVLAPGFLSLTLATFKTLRPFLAYLDAPS